MSTTLTPKQGIIFYVGDRKACFTELCILGIHNTEPCLCNYVTKQVERISNSSLILFTLLNTFGKSHLMKTVFRVSIRHRINTRDLLSFVDSSGRRKIQKKGPTMIEKSKLVGLKPHGITVTHKHTPCRRNRALTAVSCANQSRCVPL